MLSFKEHKNSKLIGLLSDSKGTVKESIFLNERTSDKLIQDKDFAEKIKKYAEDITINEEEIVESFKMKEGYRLEYCPPKFNEHNQRLVSYIVGKSGSGKSYYTAALLDKYHLMYPKNDIYYISANFLTNDSSFDKIMAKKSFKKKIKQIDLLSILTTIDFKKYNNCMFVFDDIIDVEISLDPDKIAKEYIAEQIEVRNRNSKKEMIQEYKLLLNDQVKLQRISKSRAETIKSYIISSIISLLNLGRKNNLSVIVTDHSFFSGRVSSKVLSESHNITLFPFGNVSNEKLKEFLIKKLSFDNWQANKIIENQFIKYDFLNISTTGNNFYFTSKKFNFL